MVTEFSDVFENIQLNPPSRLLLFGPPGCGKTRLINAIAKEFCLSMHSVTRANVFGKYFGESEKNLNDLFDKVSSALICFLNGCRSKYQP